MKDFKDAYLPMLGHHFRTVGVSISATTVQTYYIPAKAEALADNWALDFLVPKNKLILRIEQHYTVDELAEYFYVEKRFIEKQIIWLDQVTCYRENNKERRGNL